MAKNTPVISERLGRAKIDRSDGARSLQSTKITIQFLQTTSVTLQFIQGAKAFSPFSGLRSVSPDFQSRAGLKRSDKLTKPTL